MLAFFGALLTGPDDALRAVACALEMQRRLTEFNAEQRRQGDPELTMGIGSARLVFTSLAHSARAYLEACRRAAGSRSAERDALGAPRIIGYPSGADRPGGNRGLAASDRAACTFLMASPF